MKGTINNITIIAIIISCRRKLSLSAIQAVKNIGHISYIKIFIAVILKIVTFFFLQCLMYFFLNMIEALPSIIITSSSNFECNSTQQLLAIKEEESNMQIAGEAQPTISNLRIKHFQLQNKAFPTRE